MGLLAPFDCGADVALRLQLLQPDRQAACTALNATTGLDLLRWFEGDRAKYWKALGETSFVAAPQGRGLDTYRLWEVLSMGSVPVVTSSSLDLLFSSFPVIIVPSWDEVSVGAPLLADRYIACDLFVQSWDVVYDGRPPIGL